VGKGSNPLPFPQPSTQAKTDGMTEWVASGLFSVDPGRAGAAPPLVQHRHSLPGPCRGVGDGKVVSAVIVVCVAERGRGVFAGCCGGAVRGGGRGGRCTASASIYSLVCRQGGGGCSAGRGVRREVPPFIPCLGRSPIPGDPVQPRHSLPAPPLSPLV